MHVAQMNARPGGGRLSDPVTFVAFDVLYLRGHSLLAESYEERRAALESLHLSGETFTHDGVVPRRQRVRTSSAAAVQNGLVVRHLHEGDSRVPRYSRWHAHVTFGLKADAVGFTRFMSSLVAGGMVGFSLRVTAVQADVVGDLLLTHTFRYALTLVARLRPLSAPLK